MSAPSEPVIPAATTKERILDAAERGFARQGIGATSLRSITDEARVNAAAIHYHFGSKESLLESVLARRVLPLNQERLKRLEQLEVASGEGPIPIRPFLRAYLEPLVAMRVETDRHTAPFGTLLAWLFVERDTLPRLPMLFEDLTAQFASAACRGRDDLETAEAAERLAYAVGATHHLLHRAQARESDDASSAAERLGRLIDFLARGFEEPGCERTGCERTGALR